jgi:hypothetical protein
MPITTVTLSEGHGPGERSPSRRSARPASAVTGGLIGRRLGCSVSGTWHVAAAGTVAGLRPVLHVSKVIRSGMRSYSVSAGAA